MQYYILYNYKSALEAIVSNFSHSSIITLHSLMRVIISVLVLSIESVSDLSPGGENPCLIISTSMLLATVDSTEYHFISNLKDQQINGITIIRNSAIPTKYETIDEVELCLKILSTNCLCSPSLTLIFE